MLLLVVLLLLLLLLCYDVCYVNMLLCYIVMRCFLFAISYY